MQINKRPVAFRNAAAGGNRARSGKFNTEQLRSAIDHGRTGDKIKWPDAAAAPLGTDEEAAGTPVAPQATAAALRYETARSSNTDANSDLAEPQDKRGRTFVITLTVAIFVALLAVMYATM